MKFNCCIGNDLLGHAPECAYYERKPKVCNYCKNGYIKIYGQRVTGDTTPILVSIPCPKCWDGYWGDKKMMNLNDYAKEVHEANKKWWVCLACNKFGEYAIEYRYPICCPFCDGTKVAKRNVGEMIALMHSELSEALEGHRKGLKDDKLPQWDMVDVEMVDCLIRIMDFLGQKGVDVEQIFKDKMEFNQVREDHKLENRQKDGGKKY